MRPTLEELQSFWLLSIAAMRVDNPDRLPAGING
jgi:hypothetical protein